MLREELTALLEPVIRELGYELWELEYVTRQGQPLLRLYIELGAHGDARPVGDPASQQAVEAGITVDDCARVSHAVSEVLDAADPLPGHYTLEVSSPGLDRVLRTRAHFERFAGSEVRVEMKTAVGGRKRFAGRLAGVETDGIEVELDSGGTVRLPIDDVHKARLVPEL